MRCTIDDRWLSEYLDGELSARDIRTLEGHLAACERCAAELAALRRGVSLFHVLAEEEPPDFLRARIMAAIAAVPAATTVPRASWWARLADARRRIAPQPAWGLAAAGFVVAVGWSLFSTLPPPTTTPGAPATSARIATPPPTAGTPALRPPAGRSPGPSERVAARKPATAPPRDVRVSPKAIVGPVATRRAAPPEAAGVTSARPEAPSRTRVARAETAAREENRPSGSPRRSPGAGPAAPRMAGRVRPTRSMPKNLRAAREASAPRSDETGAATDLLMSPPMPADETMTMMASMPAMPGDTSLESTTLEDDGLASLRQRLADERRELPAVRLDWRAPATPKLPVHIEF